MPHVPFPSHPFQIVVDAGRPKFFSVPSAIACLYLLSSQSFPTVVQSVPAFTLLHHTAEINGPPGPVATPARGPKAPVHILSQVAALAVHHSLAFVVVQGAPLGEAGAGGGLVELPVPVAGAVPVPRAAPFAIALAAFWKASAILSRAWRGNGRADIIVEERRRRRVARRVWAGRCMVWMVVGVVWVGILRLRGKAGVAMLGSWHGLFVVFIACGGADDTFDYEIMV